MPSYTPYRSPLKRHSNNLMQALMGMGVFGQMPNNLEQQNSLAMQRDSQNSMNRVNENKVAEEMRQKYLLEQETRAEALRQKTVAEKQAEADMLRNREGLMNYDNLRAAEEMVNANRLPTDNFGAGVTSITGPRYNTPLSPAEQGLRAAGFYGDKLKQGFGSAVPQLAAEIPELLNRRADAQTAGEISSITKESAKNTAYNKAQGAEFESSIGLNPGIQAAKVKGAKWAADNNPSFSLGVDETRVSPFSSYLGVSKKSTLTPGAPIKDASGNIVAYGEGKVTQESIPAREVVGRIAVPKSEPEPEPIPSSIQPKPKLGGGAPFSINTSAHGLPPTGSVNSVSSIRGGPPSTEQLPEYQNLNEGQKAALAEWIKSNPKATPKQIAAEISFRLRGF